IHPGRDFPWRLASDAPDRRRVRGHGGLRTDPGPVAAPALREDAGSVGRGARGEARTGPRHSVPGRLRPVYEVPDRLREAVPAGIHRRQPVHDGEVTRSTETVSPERITVRG